MRLISFAFTTPALLAGRKTVTRRLWKDTWAAGFKAGDLVAAYDRNPRNGGHQVATIRLTADPVKERTGTMPDSDYDAEGFAWLQGMRSATDHLKNAPVGAWSKEAFQEWRDRDELLWVIRFELVQT